ncbi:MAG TPA: winged helix-turn-helix domain-containing protein [Thermoleophilaceae bacterium]
MAEKLARAWAHPLRIQILGLLDRRVASPSDLASQLGAPISNTSYHVRQLVDLGLVELVSRTARRGAIEHHYTAKTRPTITDEGWAHLPQRLKRAALGGSLQVAFARTFSAVENGDFDRADVHFSRTLGRLDKEAWEAVSGELMSTLKRVEELVEESEARLELDSELEADEATVLIMHFPSGAGQTPATRSSGESMDGPTDLPE